MNRIILAVLFIVSSVASSSDAGEQWVYYHDDEIKGSVINVETKEPIEGAIVVGMWSLVQVPGEGFGGYAKIQVVTTDKEGNFTIPSWKAFKPWKLSSVVDEVAPRIAIYKPGYKVYWSHKVMREGFPDDISKTSEEKARLKDEYSITPAKLKIVNTDVEVWEGYLQFRSDAHFPDKYYSKQQHEIIFSSIKYGVEQFLTKENDTKNKLFEHIKKSHDYWVGGKR